MLIAAQGDFTESYRDQLRGQIKQPAPVRTQSTSLAMPNLTAMEHGAVEYPQIHRKTPERVRFWKHGIAPLSPGDL
ncbi:MAG: hypothetical protein OXI37_05510 [Gammaproteobacteria bacterium]|nr:hypothetical protein [Gammaproteobacteria bacterium]